MHVLLEVIVRNVGSIGARLAVAGDFAAASGAAAEDVVAASVVAAAVAGAGSEAAAEFGVLVSVFSRRCQWAVARPW